MASGTFEITDTKAIEAMGRPVRCRCGMVYDLRAVTVPTRHADCSTWRAPCCGRQADDRTGKSLPDYYEITGEPEVHDHGGLRVAVFPDGHYEFVD